jgi:hypothetical protein
MPSYSDSYFDSFGEGIFTDSWGEGILGDSYGEGLFDSYGEASDKKRPLKVPPSVGRPSNFGGRIASSPSPSGNFATKAELKSSLNSISDQVNDLKKSSLNIANSIKRLDDGYEKIVKGIARKSQAQDNVISSTPLMTLLGTVINTPTLNPSNLIVNQGPKKDGTDDFISVVPGTNAIQVDLTKTFIFAMMPMMMSGSGSGSDNSMMMMMMMVLIVGIGGAGSGLGSGSDSTLLIMMVMMMMMNKK